MNFDPIFGEDNEIIGYIDERGEHWSVEEVSDYFGESSEPDGDWMDADALASAGWGTDEDYGYYGE